MSRYVQITHPELGTAQVVPSAVHVWTDRGWRVVAEDKKPPAKKSATPKHPVRAARPRDEGDVTAPAESA